MVTETSERKESRADPHSEPTRGRVRDAARPFSSFPTDVTALWEGYMNDENDHTSSTLPPGLVPTPKVSLHVRAVDDQEITSTPHTNHPHFLHI